MGFLAKTQYDGQLLSTKAGNEMLKAANRLATVEVRTTRAGGMERSGMMVSEENAVLTLAFRDARSVLGSGAGVDIITDGTNPYYRPGGDGTISIDPNTGTICGIPAGGGDCTDTTRVLANLDGTVSEVQAIYEKGPYGWNLLFRPCDDVISTEYRSKSGTFTLCGFDEYIASTPPRKYLRRTLSGTFERYSYFDTACTSVNCITTSTYSGYCLYDASTCSLTTAGSAVNTGCISSSSSRCDLGAPNTELGDYESLERIQKRLLNDLECHIYLTTTSTKVLVLPTALETLSDEDTEADAIARSNESLSWDFLPASVAKIETRGAGDFSAVYVYVETRSEVSGLVAGANYIARVTFGRRAYGSSDPFVEYGLQDFPFVAAGGTENTPWAALPNESGYETNVISTVACRTT